MTLEQILVIAAWAWMSAKIGKRLVTELTKQALALYAQERGISLEVM